MTRRPSTVNGRMYDAPFRLTQCTENTVEALYVSEKERYPFEFQVKIECSLSEYGLFESFEFTNTGAADMPLLFGLHTNFADKGFIKLPLGRELYVPNGDVIPRYEGPLSPLACEIAAGTAPGGKDISGFYTSAGAAALTGGFEYGISEGFTHWVLWNGKGDKGFISIEPQTGPVNGLNSDKGCIRLRPKEKASFYTSIKVRETL